MSDAAPVFLIVDDHALYRTGLAMMLGQAWPGCQPWQTASLAEGLSRVRASVRAPDLVLLDVKLPDGDGLASLLQWRDLAPQSRVVLMSSEVDAVRLQQARQAGAAGFVHKSAPPADVLASLRAALGGESAFGTLPYDLLLPDAHVGPAQDPAVARDAGALFSPSPIQVRILAYLGRGTPNKAIARQVGLSEMQVRAEVSWLTEALGASSREEAFRKAVDLGWVSA
jgi:two-component system, NarL family, nitrate/nitrite response regulator NarL